MKRRNHNTAFATDERDDDGFDVNSLLHPFRPSIGCRQRLRSYAFGEARNIGVLGIGRLRGRGKSRTAPHSRLHPRVF
jgi:hypothetical protein